MRLLNFAVAVVAFLATTGTARPWEFTGTARTVDADTIDLNDAARIRLFGIDAPEVGQKCKRADGSSWRCGIEARDRLADLVDGKTVRCTGDGLDDYRRYLGWCYVDETNLNELLVAEGLAWAFVKKASDYIGLETKARAAKVGIWQGAAQPAWEYRESRWNVAVQEAPDGCPIKGNINRKGDRIYHTPWSRDYSKTKVDTAAGERWFCNEGEALAAGWRAPLWTR